MNSDEKRFEAAMAEVKKSEEASAEEKAVQEPAPAQEKAPEVKAEPAPAQEKAPEVKAEPAPAAAQAKPAEVKTPEAKAPEVKKPELKASEVKVEKKKDDELTLTYKAIRKQNKLLTGILAMVGGMFLIMLVCAVLIVPHVLNILVQTETTIATVQQEIENLKAVEGIVDDLSKVSKDLVDANLPGLVKQTEGLVVQSSDGITSAIGKLDSIDIDSLNEAIVDLKSVVEPMAILMGGRR